MCLEWMGVMWQKCTAFLYYGKIDAPLTVCLGRTHLNPVDCCVMPMNTWHTNLSPRPIEVLINTTAVKGGFRFSERFRDMCEEQGLMKPNVPDFAYRGNQSVVRMFEEVREVYDPEDSGCSFVLRTVEPWKRWRVVQTETRMEVTEGLGGVPIVKVEYGKECLETEWPWEMALRLILAGKEDDPLVIATRETYEFCSVTLEEGIRSDERMLLREHQSQGTT